MTNKDSLSHAACNRTDTVFSNFLKPNFLSKLCEREDVVVGDEAPLSGVAQVVSHGVKVVGVHGEEGKEKDEEVRVEVEGEVKQLVEKRSSWMVCG